MKAKFLDKLHLFIVLIIMLNLVLLPEISYALAPKSQIQYILKSPQLLTDNHFHRFLFQSPLTFKQLYKAVNNEIGNTSPDSLLKRLKHDISNKKIVPVLNENMEISFKLKNKQHDRKNLMWIFVPDAHLGQRIHAEGFKGSVSLKGTVVGVDKNLMKQNTFLENYLISTEKGLLAYAHTSSLFKTLPKIFNNRADKEADIKTFHDIVNIFVGIQDTYVDDKKNIDRINDTLNVVYNMAKEGANINSIFAAIFYNEKVVKKMSEFTGIPEENLIEELVNAKDARVIREKIAKAKNLIDYPYEPLDNAQHAYPNFLYSIIQQANLSSESDPVFGKADLDILLLGIFNKIEEIDKQPLSEADKKEQLKTLKTYGPLVEMLDKNDIADNMRDICFRYNNPHEYEVLTTAIERVFDMDYGSLMNHLECDIVNRLEKCLDPISDKYNFAFRYRVKSLYSLWQKIESKHTILPDEDMTSAVEALLKEGFLRKDGKQNRLDDLYGLQVVFDIPHTLRSEEKMKEVQKQFLDLIDAEFSKDSEHEGDFLRKEKTLAKNGYREEKIMPIWKDKNGVEYRGEIQVLSDKDLKLYKHGADNGNIQAHWGYKIKSDGYVFDSELLDLIKMLQYQYTNDSHKNFSLLSNYLKKHIFTTVYQEADEKNAAHIKYLRLPAKSIIPDIASSSSINSLKAENAAQVVLTLDENGKIVVNEKKNILPTEMVKPGQIFMFGPAEDESFAFGNHTDEIIEKSQKMTTVVQMLPNKISSEEIHKSKIILEDELKNLLAKTSPNIDSHKFINYVTRSTLGFFRLNKTSDLYKLSNVIKNEPDHKILLQIGKHFFKDKLEQQTEIINLKTLYSALNLPKEDRTPLGAFAKIIASDQLGRIKLTSYYRGKLSEQTDFSDIRSWVTRNSLKKSAKRYGIKSLHQMRALIGLGLFSPFETLLEHYNDNFSYTLTLTGKNHQVNIYRLLLELENIGVKHAPTVQYDQDSIVISLTSPSLEPSDEEKRIIEHKLSQVLPKLNIAKYEISRPGLANKKFVKISPHDSSTRKQLTKIFKFLDIQQTTTGDGSIIIHIANRIPLQFLQRLLEEKLNTKHYTHRTFELSNLLEKINFKALQNVRRAA